MVDLGDAVEGGCPRCGEPATDAHVRGSEVVLVPCGHAFQGLSALDVPPEGTDGS